MKRSLTSTKDLSALWADTSSSDLVKESRIKRSLTSTKDLSSLCADTSLPDLVKEASIDSIMRVAEVGGSSISGTNHFYGGAISNTFVSSASTSGGGREESLPSRKKCRIVSPELLPTHQNFPIISSLDSLDDLRLPPPSHRNHLRESVAKQFGSSLFDMGPATAALNELELQSLSHPFKACLNISF
jgi:hypothetical protein